MKYIVYTDSGFEHLILFPRVISHNRMAEAIGTLRFGDLHGWHRRKGEVIAAGFIDAGECHGRSESLGVESREGIDTMLYRAGGSAKAPGAAS